MKLIRGDNRSKKAKVEKQYCGRAVHLRTSKVKDNHLKNQLLSSLHPLGSGTMTFLGTCVACLCNLSHYTVQFSSVQFKMVSMRSGRPI